MLRKIGIGVGILFLVLSCLALYIWGLIAGGFIFGSGYQGIVEYNATQYCEVVGIYKKYKVSSDKSPEEEKDRKYEIGEGEVSLSPPVAGDKLYYRASPIGAYGIDKSRGFSRDDITIDPKDILKWKNRNPQLYGINVGDYNRDGYLEVTYVNIQQPGEFLGGPFQYTFSLYGYRDGNIIPYLVTRCDTYPLEQYQLKDGTVGFANLPMIWHRQVYRWRNGSFRLTLEAIPSRQYDMFLALINDLWSPVTLIGLLISIIPISIIILINFSIMADYLASTNARTMIICNGLLLAYLIIFDISMLNYGYVSAIVQPVSITLPMIFTVVYILTRWVKIYKQ